MSEIAWYPKLKEKFYQLTTPMTEFDFALVNRMKSTTDHFDEVDIEWSIEPREIKGWQQKRIRLTGVHIYQYPDQIKYVIWRDRNFKWKDSTTMIIKDHPPLNV